MNTMKKMRLWSIVLLAVGVLTFSGCGDDDDGPAALEISAITATGTSLSSGDEVTVDLNAATAASDVPPDAVITITFSREVDAANVSASSVTITAGSTSITGDISATGSDVTFTPADGFERGTDYTLTITSALTAADGGVLVGATRTFKTDGRQPVVPPSEADQMAYWKFDGDATDDAGSYDANAEVSIEYQTDRFGAVGSAAYFNGNTSIIEVPNASSLMTDASSFTVSFWVKTNTEGHVNENDDPTGMFVFGLGAFFGIQYEIFGGYDGSKFAISYTTEDETAVSEDMWFPNGATDNTTGGWQGWDFAQNLSAQQMQDIIKDKWYHAIYTYDAAEKKGSLYFNGDLMKSFDFDLWPDGDIKQTVTGVTYRGAEPDVVDDLAFGFVQSRAGTMWDAEPWGGYDIPTSQHFKGWLDDFRIFKAAFSAADAADLYAAEKP
ncbi:MAG: Ig-like domain-containing protein [Fulvivirga sp.]